MAAGELLRRRVLPVIVGSFVLWCAAWLVFGVLGSRGPAADTGFWATAKVLVWVIFPVFVWRGRALHMVPRDPRELARGLLWGLVASVTWVLVSIIVDGLGDARHATTPEWYALVSVVVLTPLCEEVLCRGYVQPGLIASGVRFGYANVAATAVFVLMHCLGWAFQGTLARNILSVYPLVLVVLSLILGYLRQRSGSLLAPVILHMANNAYSVLA